MLLLDGGSGYRIVVRKQFLEQNLESTYLLFLERGNVLPGEKRISGLVFFQD
jgi:hypothetical protein